MSYCKNTDGNLAALARYEAEQDRIYEYDSKIETAVADEMENIKPEMNNVPYEALMESDEAAQAVCDLIKNYKNKEGSEGNHKLVMDLIGAVEEYVKGYVEKNL